MTDKLPAILEEIAGVIGEVAALAIASRVGGRRVYIPAKMSFGNPDAVEGAHWLIEAVGFDNAVKLCAHFAVDGRGQRVDIPLHVGGTYKQMIRAIAERIHRYDQDDLSAPAIVSKLGVTDRTVRRHRARHRGAKPSKQGKLL